MMKIGITFAVSTLVSFLQVLPQCGTLDIPPCCVEPKKTLARVGRPLGCAEWKAGVDTMRVETTFLWMSDLSIQMGPNHSLCIQGADNFLGPPVLLP